MKRSREKCSTDEISGNNKSIKYCAKQTASSSTFVNTFPIDCLVHVFEYVEPITLGYSLRFVCSLWTNVLEQYEVMLWKTLCCQKWPFFAHIIDDTLPGWKQEMNWRLFYLKENSIVNVECYYCMYCLL